MTNINDITWLVVHQKNTGNLTAEWLDFYKLIITIYTALSQTKSGEQIVLYGFRVNLRHKISNMDNCIYDVLYSKDNNNNYNKILDALKLSPVDFISNPDIYLGIQADWARTENPVIAEQLRQFDWGIVDCYDYALHQTVTPQLLSDLQGKLNESI